MSFSKNDVLITAMIDNFNSEYVFLSNFYPAPVTVDGVEYPTVEHAYQASKTLSQQERQLIRFLTFSPAQAKRRGRELTLRSDWEEVKIGIMLELVRLKFAQPTLRAKLVATGNAELIEGNTWHDTFWGVCHGVGQNHLGKILMKVREECQAQ